MYRSGKGSANRIKTKSVKVHIIHPWLGCLQCFYSSLGKFMMLSNCVRSLAVLSVQCGHMHSVKPLMLPIISLAMLLWSDAIAVSAKYEVTTFVMMSFYLYLFQVLYTHILTQTHPNEHYYYYFLKKKKKKWCVLVFMPNCISQ